MKMIKNTLNVKSPENNISKIAFSDNSSAIKGYNIKEFSPVNNINNINNIYNIGF